MDLRSRGLGVSQFQVYPLNSLISCTGICSHLYFLQSCSCLRMRKGQFQCCTGLGNVCLTFFQRTHIYNSQLPSPALISCFPFSFAPEGDPDFSPICTLTSRGPTVNNFWSSFGDFQAFSTWVLYGITHSFVLASKMLFIPFPFLYEFMTLKNSFTDIIRRFRRDSKLI